MSYSADRARAERILAKLGGLGETRDAPGDLDLGKLACEKNLVTPDQVLECIRAQEKARSEGRNLELGTLLVERGFLKTEELVLLLKERFHRSESPPLPSRYDIGKRLGEGATAVVYQAWDRELRRHVAIKVLRESAALSEVARARFHREAATAAGLAHPHLVLVHDAGESQGQLYIVMELVQGRPLSEILKEGKTREADLVRILEKAARGIGAAHEKGIVHRDLKPANVLIAADGTPKVGDFGLAHLSESPGELTRTGAPLGTPLYMSPEQVEGRPKDITARTDVYALGAILYEILTARPPLQGETLAELYGKIMREDPIAPRKLKATISRDLETIVQKALEKDPRNRYPSAKELAEDLRRSQEGEPIEARPISNAERLWRIGVRYRALLLPLAAAAFLGALGGILAIGGTLRRRPVVFLERMDGDIRLRRSGRDVPATPGQPCGAEEELDTGLWPSVAHLRFEDGTRIELGSETAVRGITAYPEKHLFLRKGTIVAGIAGDPAAVFETAHGKVRAMDATLRLTVDSGSIGGIRLEVEKGHGELTTPKGKSIAVESGRFAEGSNEEISTGQIPPQEAHVLLEGFGQGMGACKFHDGREFPGAKGSFTHDPAVGHDAPGSGKLEGDFSGGGNYVAVEFDVSALPARNFKELRLWVKTTTVATLYTQFIDDTGQTLQERFPLRLAQTSDWQEVAFRISNLRGAEHWGGAQDGKWHGPMRSFVLNVRPDCFTPAGARKGIVWIDDVRGILAGEGGTIQDPSFENQTSLPGEPPGSPWSSRGPAVIGVDFNSGRGGKNKCAFIADNGTGAWSEIFQTIAVTPNTSYTLSAWLQTSDRFPRGALGVRATAGTLIAQQSYGQLGNYTPVSVAFNSGSNTSVIVFAGFTNVAGQDAWIHADDFNLAIGNSK